MNKNRIYVVAVLVVAVGFVFYAKKANKPVDKPQVQEQSEQVAVPAVSSPSPGVTTKAALPRLVDLGAGKCIPCKMMKPVLEELTKEYQGKMDVVFIDVWEKPSEGDAYNIRTIPTQIFYDASGKELYRHEGFFSKQDILNKWKELGVVLEKVGS